MTSSTASAPAKVILTGEHAVVYNEPALVMAIDKRAYVFAETTRGGNVELESEGRNEVVRYPLEPTTPSSKTKQETSNLSPYLPIARQIARSAEYSGGFKVRIRSAIPAAAGLGSSAAIAVAMTAALARCLDMKLKREEVSKIALESEKVVHGQPSGIDNMISTWGGLIVYRRNEGFLPLRTQARLQIVVGLTGIERSTGEQVAKVAETVRHHGKVSQLLLHCIGHLTIEAVEAIRERKMETLGELLSLNHWLVNALGVSHPLLDRLVYASIGSGALGAKLTGAGGGGCIVALVNDKSSQCVMKAIESVGCTALSAQLSRTGVRIED